MLNYVLLFMVGHYILGKIRPFICSLMSLEITGYHVSLVYFSIYITNCKISKIVEMQKNAVLTNCIKSLIFA